MIRTFTHLKVVLIPGFIRMALGLCFALASISLWANSLDEAPTMAIYPPPDITISCDYWFPFNSSNPNQYIEAFDDHFGRIRGGQSSRQKIYIQDRVCPAHPRFNEFAPSNPFSDPCYDDTYSIYWGYDGYITDYPVYYLSQNIVSNLVCGRGDLIREWRLVIHPNSPPLATQRITIINCREFYVPTACWRFTAGDVASCDLIGGAYKQKLVEWPCDVEINTCPQDTPDALDPDNLPVLFDEDREPRLANANCNLVGASYEDDFFSFVDSACVKIFRKWAVIDWCLYEDYLNGTFNGQYRWSRTQVIKLNNLDGPELGDCEDRTFCGFGDPDNPASDQCVGRIEIRQDISDDCTPLEQLNIDYKIDLFNDGEYDLLGYNAGQGSTYPFPNPNNLPVRVFPDTLPNADGIYPVGTHKILWAAEDGCGNTAACSYLITVEDCKAPTAYCLPGISSITMDANSGGFLDIWAIDFNLGSTDNCSPDSTLRYSFSDDPNDSSRRFFCDDLVMGANYIDLTLFVWDEADNFSTCMISILLDNACIDQPTASVSGQISTELEMALADVMVRLDGSTVDEDITDEEGNYNFDILLMGEDYALTPEKDDHPLNGISTFDLILISRHILGIEALDSPYKLIAADINNSGDITTFDLVELRKLILQIEETFNNNTSWRFVPNDYVFPDATNPFQETFPEAYTIDTLSENMEATFVAIKTGDVDCSAQLHSDQSDNRHTWNPYVLPVKDRQLTAGETFTLDLQIPATQNLIGFQFALDYHTHLLAFDGLGETSLPQFGKGNWLNKANGQLNLSWNVAKAQVLREGQSLVQIQFTALKDTWLSDAIQIADQSDLQAEVYRQDEDQITLLQPKLQFNANPTQTQNLDWQLYQNQPNPFEQSTLIPFSLSSPQNIRLQVFDAQGRILFEKQGQYDAGMHQIEVSQDQLQAKGLLLYALTVEGSVSTYRMLSID